jgi:hypothetical protein
MMIARPDHRKKESERERCKATNKTKTRQRERERDREIEKKESRKGDAEISRMKQSYDIFTVQHSCIISTFPFVQSF